MISPKQINEAVQHIMGALPSGVKNIPKEFEQNLKSAIQGVFSKLDLVTREEFDAQAGVLLKTRKKLEGLEQQIAQLESQCSPPAKPKPKPKKKPAK